MEILGTSVAKAQPAGTERDRAFIQAHNAVQWLARVARSYAMAPGADIVLLFDPESRRVMTPEVAPGIRLGLHLPSLVFQFEEDGRRTPHSLDVDDKSTTEVEAWLLAELLHRGFDRHKFDKHLPYEWPHPMSGDEIKYAAHELSSELENLTLRLSTDAISTNRALVRFYPQSFSTERTV